MKYFLISLGVVLLLIFGIVIFNRGGSKPVSTPTQKSIKATDYKDNTNAAMQSIVAGPINANENHRSIQILISPTSRTVNIYTGYQGEVLKTLTLPNNSQAYSEFLTALNRANFTVDRRVANGLNPDAVCPTSNRTHYIISNGGKNDMDLWTAACIAGTFGGNISLTNTLFQAQIPNYSTFVSGVSLGSSSTL